MFRSYASWCMYHVAVLSQAGFVRATLSTMGLVQGLAQLTRPVWAGPVSANCLSKWPLQGLARSIPAGLWQNMVISNEPWSIWSMVAHTGLVRDCLGTLFWLVCTYCGVPGSPCLRERPLTTGGGDWKFGQNWPHVFSDPPYKEKVEFRDSPHLGGVRFGDPPLATQQQNSLYTSLWCTIYVLMYMVINLWTGGSYSG